MDFVSKCSLSTVLLHTTRTTVPLSRVARTVALLREVRARVARGTPTPHPACVRLWCSASSQIIGGVFYSPLPLTVNHACGLQINTQYSVYRGGGDSSVVRAPDSWLKGRGFESLLERRENFLLQGRLSVLTLISVSVPPPCYHSST